MSQVAQQTVLSWVGLQDTFTGTKKRAMRALVAEYSSLLKEPGEGFIVKVENPFNWEVGIFGPPSTPYWGGYFKVHLNFPDQYPFEPPKLKFRNRFWHPNVYHNGVVCMSILHDPNVQEIASGLPKEEKWNPTLSVRTVLLSLISILGSPNPDSPANPEASKMYRLWTEDGDDDYVRIIEDIVKRSKKIALREGVTIPKTLDDYLVDARLRSVEVSSSVSSVTVDSHENSDDEESFSSESCLSSPSSPDVDREEFVLESASGYELHGEIEPIYSIPVENNSSNLPILLQEESAANLHLLPVEIDSTVNYETSATLISTVIDDDALSESRDAELAQNSHQSEPYVPTDSTSSLTDVQHHSIRVDNSSDFEGHSYPAALTQTEESLTTQSRTSANNLVRKKRRPPRLVLYANQCDTKKRKKL